MIKKPQNPRYLTGAILAIATIGLISFGSLSSAIFFIIILAMGSIELANGLSSGTQRHISFYVIAGLLIPFVLILAKNNGSTLFTVGLGVSLVFNTYLSINLYSKKVFPYKRWGLYFSLLYWALPLGLVTYICLKDPASLTQLLLGIIILIWTADTMAYFIGRSFGKNKLFPSVSPNKTIEGFLGAGVCVVLAAWGLSFIFKQSYTSWIPLGVIVWLTSALGDLVESKYKRSQDLKDSGSLLPGHGGFLDRFDGLVFAIPFVLVFELLHYPG